MRYAFLFIWLLFAGASLAQLPTSHVYLFDFYATDEANFYIGKPRLVTSDHPNGYNNQPHFVGNLLYIASARGSNATDVYAYDLAKQAVTPVTRTRMSEFSPTVMPDGAHFSAVCIEADNTTQRLWKYPIGRSGKPALLLPDLKGVGYHAWLNAAQLAVFVLGTPANTLQLVDANAQTASRTIAENVGRSIQTQGDYVYFVQKSDKQSWAIKRYDVQNYDLSTIAITLPEREDFILLPDQTLLMGHGSTLFKLKMGKDKEWIAIADLAPLGIRNISRLAFDSGRLALVSDK